MSVRKDARICKIIFTLKINISELQKKFYHYVYHYVLPDKSGSCVNTCFQKGNETTTDRLRRVGLSLAVSARSSVVWTRP